jgi:hypothetical protein
MSGLGVGELVWRPRIFCIVFGIPEMTLFYGAPDVRSLQNTRCKTKSIVFHRKKNNGADISGIAASGRAHLRPPPGFSVNSANLIRDLAVDATEFIAEVPAHAHTRVAHNA